MQRDGHVNVINQAQEHFLPNWNLRFCKSEERWKNQHLVGSINEKQWDATRSRVWRMMMNPYDVS